MRRLDGKFGSNRASGGWPAATDLRTPRMIAIGLAVFLGGFAGTVVASSLEPFGLQGKSVTSLGFYGSLYAGTIDEGVFRRSLTDSTWTPLGLEGKRIRAIYPHKFGPLQYATSAGIELSPTDPDSALVYCSILDQPPWAQTDSGMTPGVVSVVQSLDGFEDPSVCGETFAATIGSGGLVWRRGLTSTHWEPVLDLGFGVGNVVRADPISGNVWAGGETSIFAPWIARSTDQGDTWDVAYPDLAGDNACNSIVVHPCISDMAFAGMEGAVIQTTDGGVTWSYTGLRDTPAYTYGIAMNCGVHGHQIITQLLAGGMIASPNNWGLWESVDGGTTWQEIPPPVLDPPAQVSGISAIVADPNASGVFYIATFGHGVWKYVNPVTDTPAPLPRHVFLEQNYPNPFNPSTAMRFDVPAAQHLARVQLAIYDVHGRLVRVLVDRNVPAGQHRAEWNGTDAGGGRVASGVYIGRLRVGEEQQVRKLSLVR
jgi:hypothetical protein